MAGEQRVEQAVAEQAQSEVARIYERLGPVFDSERMRLAQLLAGKDDGELFGQTEYEVRDQVHRLGAKALEVAVDERQKKGWIRGC